MVIGRSSRLTNFFDYMDFKLVFKRYASLYFVTGVEKDDNELMVLEVMHHFVELLDRYFGNVCELDIMFHVEKAHWLIDEMVMAGSVYETNRANILAPLQMLERVAQQPAS